MKNVLRLIVLAVVFGIAYSFYPLMAISVGAFIVISSLILGVPKIIARIKDHTSREDEQDEEDDDQENDEQVDPIPYPVDDPV